MPGSEKPGDAKADVAREKFKRNNDALDDAITRLEIRAEMKSLGEDEVSAVIDQRALEAQRKKESEPPSGYARQATWFIRSVRGWPQAVVGLAALALAAWWMWLHR